NFRKPKYINELGKIVDLERDVDTYLVLSLTTKTQDLSALYEQFKPIPLKKIIFTKSDETKSYGAILNLVTKYKMGIGYLTNGQNVPDDLLLANPELLAKLLMESDEADD